MIKQDETGKLILWGSWIVILGGAMAAFLSDTSLVGKAIWYVGMFVQLQMCIGLVLGRILSLFVKQREAA